jgi:predicted O-methyltransferase YrrM
MKIAIIITTYWKLDGSTKTHLERALMSVRNQTSNAYKVFLIGDDYEKEDELMELSKIIDKDRIYVENLPVALERTVYSGVQLWACGGANATRTGIRRALSEGYIYISELNHDDYYLPHHIETVIKSFKETGTHFLTTKCNTKPEIETKDRYSPYRPFPGRNFLASVCYNHSHYPVFRRQVEETVKIYGKVYAGDADKWNQIRLLMEKNNEWGVFVNELTCYKMGGKVPINNPDLVKRYNVELTSESLRIVDDICISIPTKLHHHFHVLYDIGRLFEGDITYVEIGCMHGRSASLMMHRPKTNIISIDIGTPIDKEVATKNIQRFNKHKNGYSYIKGDSQDRATIKALADMLGEKHIDILFIDGSHRFQDVVNDFVNYSDVVGDGGFIVFDDYHDDKFSPEVKKALNHIVAEMSGGYDIIGTLPNTTLAHPKEIRSNNCFIMRKWQKGFTR